MKRAAVVVEEEVTTNPPGTGKKHTSFSLSKFNDFNPVFRCLGIVPEVAHVHIPDPVLEHVPGIVAVVLVVVHEVVPALTLAHAHAHTIVGQEIVAIVAVAAAVAAVIVVRVHVIVTIRNVRVHVPGPALGREPGQGLGADHVAVTVVLEAVIRNRTVVPSHMHRLPR